MNCMLLSATILAAVALVQGQSTAERLGEYRNNLFINEERQRDTNYFIAAVDRTSVLEQLMITDAEAVEICKVWAPSVVTKYTGHPKTCSANLICTRVIDDPFSSMGGHIYAITVYITPVAKGLFWSGNGSVHIGANTACSSDPCVTDKAISEGLNCYAYITCQRSQDEVSYLSRDCPVGQGFDVESGTCVQDSTCEHPQASNDFTDLYCNKTTPPVYYTGVDENSYFNRTIQYVNGTIAVLPNEFCSASLVLDIASLPACKCIPETNPTCPKTLVRFARDPSVLEEGFTTWVGAPDQDGSFSVQDDSNSFFNMARFSGAANSYYVAGGVDSNDMANNFNLSFIFALAQTTYPMSLMSNSRRVMGSVVCQSPTIDVYINQNGRVTADVVTFDETTGINGVTLSVTSNTGFSANQPVNVFLRRHEGYLKLRVNNENEVQSSQTFGNRRVKSTNCGLIFGTSGARTNNLNGWMDNVALYHDC